MSVQASNGHVTAEVCDQCQPILIAMQNRNIGLEETIRRQASALGAARRKLDPETRAKEHERWGIVGKLFDLWRRECSHPRSRFSPARFHQALPYVEAHGIELCERAIRGAAYDPWITKRKNGTDKRHDDWSQDIFKNDLKFEEACNKAPLSTSPSGEAES